MASRAEYMREYQKKNRERLNEYQRKWNHENPDRIRAINERYWRKRLGLADPDTGNDDNAIQA